MTFRSIESIKGDLNDNGISADAGDLVLMKRASIGEINFSEITQNNLSIGQFLSHKE